VASLACTHTVGSFYLATVMRLFLVLGLGLLIGIARAAVPPDPLSTLRPGHPRLLFTDADLATAVQAAKADPLRAALHQRLVAAAEEELGSKPIAHVLKGPRLLDQSRTCVRRVLICSLAFRLTGDRRFSDRAMKEMAVAAAFPDWNPSHFLDVAEMSTALAIGYDWLYPVLTDTERGVIRTALLKHALVFATSAYASTDPTKRPSDRRLWFVTAHHNWNQVCNAGLLAAALALADEEPELARTVIAGVRRSLPLAMAAYQPAGAYPEGPGYWEYGTTYNVAGLAMLESALGTDFGLSLHPAFDRTASYRLHIQSPSGLAFNHADGGARLGPSVAYTWLANRFGDLAAQAHSRALLAHAIETIPPGGITDRVAALHAVWFPAKGNAEVAAKAPLDAHFPGVAELATFRSAWNDPRALYLGFKAGSNTVNHAHLDLGSFVLDADGVRWSHDLGPDDYNLPAYFGAKRWTYYRLNNLSHSTLTPGNILQDPRSQAPLRRFVSTPARAYAVADLTAVYPGTTREMRRGAALLDRRRVLIQDEATGLTPGTALTWRMLTEAKVQLSANGRNATLTQKGRTLQAEILSPAGVVFSSQPATPPSKAERQNAGFTELKVLTTADAARPSDVRLAVLLTPIGQNWTAPSPAPLLQPLVDWVKSPAP